MTHQLLVSEVFGPTIQGEGPSAGRRAGFLRLGLCNLDCSWCDTPYTWDWTGKNGKAYDKADLERVSLERVVERLRNMNVLLVVITGGEPLIQQKNLSTLVAALRLSGLRVEIETNGTIAPAPTLDTWEPRYNVSPKLANSGVDRDRAWKLDALRALVETDRAIFKFVVTGEADLEEVDLLVARADLPTSRVWVMPEGRTQERLSQVLKGVADAAIARRYNVSTRLHVELWGDERGR